MSEQCQHKEITFETNWQTYEYSMKCRACGACCVISFEQATAMSRSDINDMIDHAFGTELRLSRWLGVDEVIR